MLSTVALLTAMTLAPAQGATLECKNARFTYGLYGQNRKTEKFLPNDVVFMAFDVEGLKIKNTGEIRYSMGFQITKKTKDGKDKNVMKREPADYTAFNNLGKGALPSSAIWQIPKDEEPGQYTFTVNIEDSLADKKTTLKKDFEVLPSKFGFAQVCVTGMGGTPAPPIAVPGQYLELRWIVVGADADKKDKKCKVNFTAKIQENGKDVVEKPFTGDVESDSKVDAGVLLFQPYPIHLNRAGNFKVILTAKCNVSGATTTDELDLKVVEPK